MKSLVYSSETTLLSFALKDQFEEIVLLNNSQEMKTVTSEKITDQNIKNMTPLFFDLKHLDYSDRFDIILTR